MCSAPGVERRAGLVEEHPPAVTLRAASSAVRVLRLDRGVALALARAHPEAAAAFAAQAHAKRIGAFLRIDETFRELDARGLELLVSLGRESAWGRRRGGREGERTIAGGSSSRAGWSSKPAMTRRGATCGSFAAGDVFGEIGALEATVRLTTVTAVSDSTLLELDGSVLSELGELDPTSPHGCRIARGFT